MRNPELMPEKSGPIDTSGVDSEGVSTGKTTTEVAVLNAQCRTHCARRYPWVLAQKRVNHIHAHSVIDDLEIFL